MFYIAVYKMLLSLFFFFFNLTRQIKLNEKYRNENNRFGWFFKIDPFEKSLLLLFYVKMAFQLTSTAMGM